MLSLIDGDLIIYKVGFTTEQEEEWIAKARCDEMIDGILLDTKADEYEFWLSDRTENNFRTKFYPEYKANRKDQKKPKHYEFLKEYVLNNWNARVACNQEADDALGIAATRETHFCDFAEVLIKREGDWYAGPPSCPEAVGRATICSIDKDLLQIPGKHYNFVKKEFQFVTPTDGIRSFYKQLLVGDPSDNLQGCPKIGDVKATRMLTGLHQESELYDAIRRGYFDSYERYIFKQELTSEQEEFVWNQIKVNGICLKIRQQEDEVWDFLKLRQMEEGSALSTALTQEECAQSTEQCI